MEGEIRNRELAVLAYFFKKGGKIVKLVRVTGRPAAVSKIFVFGMLREI